MKNIMHFLVVPMMLIAMQSSTTSYGSQPTACNDESTWQTVSHKQAKKQNKATKLPQSKSTPKCQSQNKKKNVLQNKGYSIDQAAYNAEFPALTCPATAQNKDNEIEQHMHAINSDEYHAQLAMIQTLNPQLNFNHFVMATNFAIKYRHPDFDCY